MLIQILFILNLLFISYTDFKERKVFLLNLFLCFLIANYIHYKNSSIFEIYLYSTIINTGITLFIVSILYAYSKFKLRINFSEAIGIGDLLFFIILATGFPTVSFLVILTTSLIFSLLFFLSLRPVLKTKTVPLAGLQALFLILLLISNSIFKIVNLYAM